MTYQEIINKLNDQEPFSFSRFGDGELNCMFGKTGANCDGHEYFPDLGERLNKAFLEPKGVVGVQRYGYSMYKDRLGPNVWADADVLHRASIAGELKEFLDSLYAKNHDIVFVGPERLRGAIPSRTFIDVPLKNAWENYDYTLKRLGFHIMKWDIVLYCCGMMAEVLIHDLHDEKLTQIDCGSLFDPYVGVKSRQYHHKLKL